MFITLAALIVGISLGVFIGQTAEAKHWASKATVDWGTAIHHAGQFYHVVTEDYYSDLKMAEARMKALQAKWKSVTSEAEKEVADAIKPAVFADTTGSTE